MVRTRSKVENSQIHLSHFFVMLSERYLTLEIQLQPKSLIHGKARGKKKRPLRTQASSHHMYSRLAKHLKKIKRTQKGVALVVWANNDSASITYMLPTHSFSALHGQDHSA